MHVEEAILDQMSDQEKREYIELQTSLYTESEMLILHLTRMYNSCVEVIERQVKYANELHDFNLKAEDIDEFREQMWQKYGKKE